MPIIMPSIYRQPTKCSGGFWIKTWSQLIKNRRLMVQPSCQRVNRSGRDIHLCLGMLWDQMSRCTPW
ncbi:hypothetical protein Nepgr_015440 [Nepenthes gracilis]|uniref:Uncharacterized protein n=1 Tax=Nepenthes gracilis TaxID=150966 RepID=A0AAD3SMW7_NEPGR|nr:hypothetical protein Nepgr_015440 [Nepenthes gracilis]